MAPAKRKQPTRARRPASEDECVAELDLATREKRWDDVARIATSLHARNLPIVPFDSPQWLDDLRDRLAGLRGRFTFVRKGIEEGATHGRVARVERVLRALEIGDEEVVSRLDKIAHPYIRRHSPSFDPDVERDRPVAAENLKDWWAAQLMGFAQELRSARDLKWTTRQTAQALNSSATQAAKTFADTLLDSTFVSLREDLPKDWRLSERLRRVANMVIDLVERDLLDETSPDFDELGEQLARRAMRALGYPNPKTRSLFDPASKRLKRST